MKKLLKIVGIVLLIIIIALSSTYLYLTDFGKRDLLTVALSHEPRSAKTEIPVTYNISWWYDKKYVRIDSLKVDIIDSKLNLFNSKSLVSYTVSGELVRENCWCPKIKTVHLSERIDNDSLHSRIIVITPVVELIQTKDTSSELSTFSFTNEHTIISNKWGANTIKFVCGKKEQAIELSQTK